VKGSRLKQIQNFSQRVTFTAALKNWLIAQTQWQQQTSKQTTRD
jgi:hypothetical protein